MILREYCCAKLHRLKVTETNINYEGSLTVDQELLDSANMRAGEKVQVVNINNGERFETYLLSGKRGSGVVCLNGAAARKGVVGDLIIVISYALVDESDWDNFVKKFNPKAVLVNESNKIDSVISIYGESSRVDK